MSVRAEIGLAVVNVEGRLRRVEKPGDSHPLLFQCWARVISLMQVLEQLALT
jgi:hypothetical protein